MDSASEKSTKDSSHPARVVNLEDVDVAAALDSDEPLDPEVAARLRCAYAHAFRFESAQRWVVPDGRSTGISCLSCAVSSPYFLHQLKILTFITEVIYL